MCDVGIDYLPIYKIGYTFNKIVMGKKQSKNSQNPKQKKQKKSNIESQQQSYLFRLKRRKNTNIICHYGDIEADFNPINTWAGIQQNTLPIFNRDKCYWTKSFIVGLRKDYYMSCPLKEKEKFAQKYQRKTYYDYLSSHESFQFQMQPLPKSGYCYICEKDFGNNYYHHIRHQEHRKNEDKGKGSEYIYELVAKYQQASKTPIRQVVYKDNIQRTNDKNSSPKSLRPLSATSSAIQKKGKKQFK